MGKINSVICNLTNLKNLFNGFNNITYESNATIEKPQVNNVTSIGGKEVELMDLSVDNNSNDNNIAMKALKNYGDNLRDKAETVGSIADTTAGALRTGIGEIVGGWAYVTGNMSSQDVDSVMADIKQDNKKHTITNALTNVVDTVEGTKQDTLNTAIDVTKDFTSATKDVLTGKMSVSDYYEKTEATKINLSVGIVEGVGNWGEKIYDTINLKSNYYIGKADVALGIRTQEQFDENMTRVKEQVATDQTKYIYDWFYGDTKVGQNIQEKSFATNEVRTTGNMAGEVGMNIGMAYVGGELVGSSSVVSELGVSGQKAAQIGSKVFAASSAGATGYGEAASKAYQNGATIEQGMIAGEVNGAVRAAQYAIGGKINETNPFANQVSNSALHVGLDAVDGASDALIQPAVELIYKDGTYDTNGNYVKFDETESITSKYSKVFNENGGWNTVINSAKTGAIFSAASEAGGVAKYFKYDDNGATKNAINSVENTTNVSGAAKQAIDIDDSSKIISTETTKFNSNLTEGNNIYSKDQLDVIDTYIGQKHKIENVSDASMNSMLRNKINVVDSDDYGYFASYENMDGYAKVIDGKDAVDQFFDNNIKAINNLDSTIRQTTMKSDTKLYRYIDSDNIPGVKINNNTTAEQIISQLQKNGIYSDSAFISTSTVESPTAQLGTRDIVFEINCKKGTPALDISSYNPSESEVLLTAGQKFNITDAKQIYDPNTNSYQWHVYMDTIDDIDTKTITNGINNVNNTKNAINSSNEVNAGSVTKKIDEAPTTKVDVDTDSDVKVKNAKNIDKSNTSSVDDATAAAEQLYKKGYNIDEINEMTKGYTDTDFKNLLENMDSIPSKLDYVGFNQYKDTKITKDQMVKGIDSLSENHPAYKQQLEKIKQNLGDVKYVSDETIKEYSSVFDTIIEKDWYTADYDYFGTDKFNIDKAPLGDNIKTLSNFSGLELLDDGTYKYSHYDVGKVNSENIVRYALSNNLDLDGDSNTIAIQVNKEVNNVVDYYSNTGAKVSKFNGTDNYMYTRTENIVNDCKSLMDSKSITDAEKTELSSYYNDMLTKQSEIETIKAQSTDGITKDNYEKLSAAYDELEILEKKASQINNNAWERFGNNSANNPTLVHGFSRASSDGCPSYKDLTGAKICTAVSSKSAGNTIADQADCGIEYKINKDTINNIVGLRAGDADSYDYSNDKMWESFRYNSMSSQQINGTGIRYNEGDHSSLVSPDQMEKAIINIKNGTVGDLYTEVVLKNDSSMIPSNYYITETTPDSIVNQMKELAKKDGLPLYKINTITSEKVEVSLD